MIGHINVYVSNREAELGLLEYCLEIASASTASYFQPFLTIIIILR
jgi:hypothetical protein